MINYYIHQIGSIDNEKTYERLVNILKSKMICSRCLLEKLGIKLDCDNVSFKFDVPEDRKWMYYEDDIHKDRVSLSDPENQIIKKCIEKKFVGGITCFNYNYIGFAISREIPIVLKEQTMGLAMGEVQVFDKIDSEYIVGLILPISLEQLQDEFNKLIVDKIFEMCEENEFPLNIYNYEGELLKSKEKNKNKWKLNFYDILLIYRNLFYYDWGKGMRIILGSKNVSKQGIIFIAMDELGKD